MSLVWTFAFQSFNLFVLATVRAQEVDNAANSNQKLLRQLRSIPCDLEDVILSDFQQWKDEEGYWIGDYDFYESSGETFTSSQWPFSYKQYRGFITGNVAGNAYRQRNVFVYPPISPEKCGEYDGNLTGMFHGTCGMNGNTKLFEADQEATDCIESMDGSISGPYAGVFDTKTDMIGNNNAVLYQVTLRKDAFGPGFPPEACLFQSQLTTITRSSDGKQVFRTRSAQSFECFNPVTYGQPTSLSFYRERKVEQKDFMTAIEAAMAEFNVTKGDTCAWENDASGNAVPSPYYNNSGIDACMLHLNQSFSLKGKSKNTAEEPTAPITSNTPIASSAMNRKTRQSASVLPAIFSSILLLFVYDIGFHQ